MTTLSDHEQIQQLMYRYAQGCDQKNATVLEKCFAPDIELIVPNAPAMTGPGLGAAIADNLDSMFLKTQHRVFNTLYQVNGDSAQGETYCSALHLLKQEGEAEQTTCLEWAIRYQDQLVRINGDWKIARRELVIDWTEQRSV